MRAIYDLLEQEFPEELNEELRISGYEARYYPAGFSSSNPERFAVKKEVVEKWRKWGMPEQYITREIRRRAVLPEIRRREEKIRISGFAYLMPRLPEIEKSAWGFAKSIDCEGTIRPEAEYGRKRKINETYRYEYYYMARVSIETKSYPLIAEYGDMCHLAVTPEYRGKLGVFYLVPAAGGRAVRTCYLIEPHLKVQDKKRRAQKVLRIYRQTATIPR